MDEETSLISMHPIVRNFVFSIIRTIKERDFSRDEKIIMDASLTPKLSENTMKASMRIDIAKRLIRDRPRPILKRRNIPVHPRMVVIPNSSKIPVVHKRVNRPAPKIVAPISNKNSTIDESDEYGKVSPLLNDPSVSTIECSGGERELMIIRMGQKQRTRIILTEKEIGEFLEEIANKTHIPLMDGVFRASVDGFSINAVISKAIGSRFILKKSTPYNLLE